MEESFEQGIKGGEECAVRLFGGRVFRKEG